MKILLLSPNQINRYNWGHELFRQSIKQIHDVTYYGDGFPNYNSKLSVQEILKNLNTKFDIILTYGLRYTETFSGLGDINNIPKIHIVIDYFPAHPAGYKGSWPRQHKFFELNKFSLLLVRQLRQVEDLKNNHINIPSKWLPFSVETDIYKKLNLSKIFDVLTSATVRDDVYPNRRKINQLIKRMNLKLMNKRVVHNDYVKAINQSKICVISTNIFQSPNMKFTEFMSCGTFVLSDKPNDIKQLGFKDGEHFVIYNDLKDLEDKLKYFLKNEKEREGIAKQGMKFVRKNHSNQQRVKEFTNIVEEFLNGN